MTNEEIIKRLYGRLTEREALTRPCPSCGRVAWHLQNRFTRVPALFGGNQTPFTPPGGYPAAVTICGHCGHMNFHNLIGLGFKTEEIDQMVFTSEPASPPAKPDDPR